ncbi:hypothetical protein FCL40_13615 [Ferrimonas sediminicola]|uniref:Uncharacterized protein n=1 Tax=Ferrimonas sediminicola TaxID=2569538 RepID=A0A4U1BCF8_9GAMM|nr:hypothetical protein [Ferrimonas sediminicola]TKB48162.1 hypothetical protein FCL40_13615 [Ferrimonas sediminicola]
MRKIILVSSLVWWVTACGSDGSETTIPDIPDASVTLSQADSIRLTVDSVSQDTLSINFRLTNEQGQVITDAASSYEVMYLGFPGHKDSSFSVPWHEAKRFVCDAKTTGCDGEMIEVSQGVYQFTPGNLPDFIDSVETLKYSITIRGELASNTFQLYTLT